MSGALSRYRICDFTGQLAGAGATKWIAAFGAEVIRIEDPVRPGTLGHPAWHTALRRRPPRHQHGRRLQQPQHGQGRHHAQSARRPREKLLAELIAVSDVVSENFAKGVLERWGFGYERMREIKPDIIYVSNCGFGHRGPYSDFKSWGPIVQAISGLTFTNGLPGEEPAGLGLFLHGPHRRVLHGDRHTACAHAPRANGRRSVGGPRVHGRGAHLTRTCTLLDWTVNGRPMRREGKPDSNRK